MSFWKTRFPGSKIFFLVKIGQPRKKSRFPGAFSHTGLGTYHIDLRSIIGAQLYWYFVRESHLLEKRTRFTSVPIFSMKPVWLGFIPTFLYSFSLSIKCSSRNLQIDDKIVIGLLSSSLGRLGWTLLRHNSRAVSLEFWIFYGGRSFSHNILLFLSYLAP